MQKAARNIEPPRLALGYATVASRNGDDVIIHTSTGRTSARKAFGCLLIPEAGDQVLISEDNFGRSYVLSVLERSDDLAESRIALNGPTRIEVTDGDMTLTAESGLEMTSPAHIAMAAVELDVHAGRAEIAIEETHMTGKSFSAGIERIRTVARTMDSFIKSWVQRMSSCFRYVGEIDETQAVSSRQLVEGTLTVQTGNSVHMAEGHIKIDAEQIHLG